MVKEHRMAMEVNSEADETILGLDAHNRNEPGMQIYPGMQPGLVIPQPHIHMQPVIPQPHMHMQPGVPYVQPGVPYMQQFPGMRSDEDVEADYDRFRHNFKG